MSQFPDGCTYSRLFTKLEIYDPIEIILPSSLPETGNKNLFDLLINFNDKINLTKVERKFFNDECGWKCVQNLCHQLYQSKIEIETKDKYYCLSALAALIKYIEYIENITFTANSLKISYTGSEQTMLIDPLTAKNLELIVNEIDAKINHTLFDFLDYTKTKGGCRLLRATIREPSCNPKTIEPRYDLIADLLADPELHFGLSEILSKFVDIDMLIFSLIKEPKIRDWKNGERKIETCIYLKHILKLIVPLKELLKTATHSIFLHYSLLLDEPGFQFIEEEINTIINPQVKLVKDSINIKKQKCFAINSEVNGFLDAKREAYNRLRDEIEELFKNVSSKYLLPIKLNYNTTRGYYFQLNLSEKNISMSTLPSEFIRISRKGKCISFTTVQLLKKNVHLSIALEDIFKESNEILSALFSKIQTHIGCLYKLSEIIAFLDLIQSFSCVSAKFNMSRPELGNTMAIKGGLHPYLLKLKKNLTPNDIYLSEDSHIWIITGPNMSGKSTFLRQICLLQIMAQCGCFVPAEKAAFRISDQIFSRIGSDDDLESNCSTFTVELKEAKYILENVTNLSLIIFDELGKGTSYEEGVSLSWAIIESLVESKAFIIAATHFALMSQLEWLYYNTTNHYFHVECFRNEDSNTFHSTFSLKDGVIQNLKYGITLAEMSDLPKEVITLAKEKAMLIQSPVQELQSKESKILRLKYKIALHLITLAAKTSFKKEILPQYLKDLKAKYDQQLAKIEQS